MALELVVNNLRDGYNQLKEGTLQHWDQLSIVQIKDAELQKQSFWTADYPQYSLEGRSRKPVLSLARHTKRHPNNLVLVHINDKENSSYDQLINNRNFKPNPEEAREVMMAADTLRARLDQLPLQGNDPTYRYIAIRTADGFVLTSDGYKKPKSIVEQVLDRAGYTKEFLETLRDSHLEIQETRLFLLSPEYVTKEAVEGPIGRVAWRYYFSSNADSNANDHIVNVRNGLFGVRRVVAAGAGAKNEVPSAPVVPREITPAICYKTLLTSPDEALRALDEKTASGLLGIVSRFYAGKTQ